MFFKWRNTAGTKTWRAWFHLLQLECTKWDSRVWGCRKPSRLEDEQRVAGLPHSWTPCNYKLCIKPQAKISQKIQSYVWHIEIKTNWDTSTRSSATPVSLDFLPRKILAFPVVAAKNIVIQTLTEISKERQVDKLWGDMTMIGVLCLYHCKTWTFRKNVFEEKGLGKHRERLKRNEKLEKRD